jgi:hypothetical protein
MQLGSAIGAAEESPKRREARLSRPAVKASRVPRLETWSMCAYNVALDLVSYAVSQRTPWASGALGGGASAPSSASVQFALLPGDRRVRAYAQGRCWSRPMVERHLVHCPARFREVLTTAARPEATIVSVSLAAPPPAHIAQPGPTAHLYSGWWRSPCLRRWICGWGPPARRACRRTCPPPTASRWITLTASGGFASCGERASSVWAHGADASSGCGAAGRA